MEKQNAQQATTLGNQTNLINKKWKVFCAVLALLYGGCVWGMDYDENEFHKNPWSESKQETSDQRGQNEKLETQIAKLQQQLNDIKQNIKNNHQEMIEIAINLRTYIKEQMEKSQTDPIKTTNITFGGEDPYAYKNSTHFVQDKLKKQQNKVNFTFGGINPYTSLKVHSDEQIKQEHTENSETKNVETEKTKPTFTFGGQDPYAPIKDSSKVIPDERAHDKNKRQENKPNVTFGGQNPYISIKKSSKVLFDGQVQDTDLLKKDNKLIR